MEQKNKTFIIRKSMYVMLFLFIVGIVGDIVTTLIAINKHKSLDFETNPAFVLGIPLWVLIVVLIFFSLLLLRMYLKKYYQFGIYFRYFLTYFLVFIVLLKFATIINNINTISYETKDIVPIQEDERIEAYNDAIMDLKIVDNIAPKKFKIPLAVSMFFWNFMIFILFTDFEKGFKDG